MVIDTDRAPAEEELRVLRAYGLRDVSIRVIADTQGLTRDHVQAIIDAWAHDDREQAKAVLREHDGESPPATIMPPTSKKSRTRPATGTAKKETPMPSTATSTIAIPESVEEPVTAANGTALADKPATATKKESVFPLPEGPDLVQYPELDELTGAEIIALIHDGDLSDVAATRNLADKVKAALSKLVTTVRAEQADARERIRREQITMATKTRAARLAREAEALAAGEVETLTRDWMARTTGKPVAGEVTFEQIMEFLHSA